MRLLMVLGLLVGVAGCGDDTSTVGLLGQRCNVTNECAEPLRCIQVNNGRGGVGMCSAPCADNADTSCQAIDAASVCREMHCTYTCNLGGNCPYGNRCVPINQSIGRCAPE